MDDDHSGRTGTLSPLHYLPHSSQKLASQLRSCTSSKVTRLDGILDAVTCFQGDSKLSTGQTLKDEALASDCMLNQPDPNGSQEIITNGNGKREVNTTGIIHVELCELKSINVRTQTAQREHFIGFQFISSMYSKILTIKYQLNTSFSFFTISKIGLGLPWWLSQ